MPSYVALDIETTGLDSASDAIIEIGALRFNGRRVESEWSTLVNPKRPIPPFISQLTGINNDMVRNAPFIKDVLPDLASFAGDAPILGHNVRFDLSFLNRQGVLTGNESIDTYELAAILLPTATRYNLGMLAQSLGILLPATHRALDDARATHAVYVQLYEKALELPVDLLAEFVRQSEEFYWGAAWIFKQILRARAREPIQAKRAGPSVHGALFAQVGREEYPPLVQDGKFTALNADEVCALLDNGGPFARYFPNYEHRPQQVDMLRAITQALCGNQHLLVEAGTGTGKSFAYLAPAALWALQNNSRVVISTNTIALQDQLIQKDIPDLCKALGLNLRTTVLKGKGNYLCPRRLELMRSRGPENPDEMRVLAKVLVWLQESVSGDRSEINLNGPAERDVWNRLSAEDDGCKTEVCVKRTGGACPFYRARKAAQAAHVVIVNHALLLADIAAENRVIPEYKYLVIDEAHHLEAATTDGLSFEVNRPDLERRLRDLGGPNAGLLGQVAANTRAALPPELYGRVDHESTAPMRLFHRGAGPGAPFL